MEDQQRHFFDYLMIIIKRWYLVVTVFVVSTVIALVTALSATPIYRATTKVLIEKEAPKIPQMLNFYYYQPYDPEFYQTQYQLIKSTSVGERVVKKLDLHQTYDSFFKDTRDTRPLYSRPLKWFKSLLGIETEKPAEKIEPEKIEPPIDLPGTDRDAKRQKRIKQLARMIASGIVVSPVQESRIVEISYRSPNPRLAAEIANSVAQAYLDEVLDMKMSNTKYTIRWLTEKASEEAEKLEQAEQQLQTYMRENDIVTLEDRLAIIPERLSSLGGDYLEAETDRKKLSTLYRKIQRAAGGDGSVEAISAIGEDPAVKQLRQRIRDAELEILQLSKNYGPKHPKMIKAKSDLEVLREKKEEEIERRMESIKNEYELARENAQNLEEMLSQTKAEAIRLNEKFVQYSALKRDVENSRQLYESLVKRTKEQNITEEIQTVTVWIIERAEPPASPASPNRPRTIFIGMILGLAGGILLVFFIDYLDNTVKTPEDAEDRLGVPVLGMIKLLKSRTESIDSIVNREPQSTLAENYKALRTAVLLSAAEAPPKSILITSMSSGEGKTATSANLALSISHAGYRTLLMDADLRRPRIHKIFGVDNSTGLSSFLAGASRIEKTIHSIEGEENIFVLPSGPIPPNPSELLGSSRMNELLDMLENEYDIIICDSPPLLSVADSMILSKAVEGTIIVSWAGKTTYNTLSRGIKSLDDIQAQILGLLINAIDVSKSDYYYSRYYGELSE